MSNTGKKQRGKPVKKINYNMKKKLVILFSLVLLALVALTLRITYINATSGSRYKKQVLSQAQQKYESQTLPAKRGDIYDKNGNILATSNKVYKDVYKRQPINRRRSFAAIIVTWCRNWQQGGFIRSMGFFWTWEYLPTS